MIDELFQKDEVANKPEGDADQREKRSSVVTNLVEDAKMNNGEGPEAAEYSVIRDINEPDIFSPSLDMFSMRHYVSYQPANNTGDAIGGYSDKQFRTGKFDALVV